MAVSYKPEMLLIKEIFSRVQNGEDINEVREYASSELKKIIFDYRSDAVQCYMYECLFSIYGDQKLEIDIDIARLKIGGIVAEVSISKEVRQKIASVMLKAHNRIFRHPKRETWWEIE